MKPARLPPHAHVCIRFWNAAGHQSLICPAHEARHIARRLTAEGAVVWHSEVYNA